MVPTFFKCWFLEAASGGSGIETTNRSDKVVGGWGILYVTSVLNDDSWQRDIYEHIFWNWLLPRNLFFKYFCNDFPQRNSNKERRK